MDKANLQESIELLEQMNINPELICRFCNSILIYKCDSIPNKDGLPKQRYYCRECKKRFVYYPMNTGGIRGLPSIDEFTAEVILSMSKQNYSSLRIHDFLLVKHKKYVSQTSINQFIRKRIKGKLKICINCNGKGFVEDKIDLKEREALKEPKRSLDIQYRGIYSKK